MAFSSLKLVGQTLGGKYRLDECLNAGGAGSVFRATDLRSNQLVALKVLRSNARRNLERFRAEAELAVRLKHPQIVETYEAGLGNLPWFLAMEYVVGSNLRGYLLRYCPPARPIMPRGTAYLIAGQIWLALSYAHRLDIAHNDLKPENVLIDHEPSGRVRGAKLTDFGIATVRGKRASGDELLPQSPYTAPEQLLGLGGGPAADLYAFGVLLGELLTGHHPLADDVPPYQEGQPVVVTLTPDVPAVFQPLLSQLLHPSPRLRQFAAALVTTELAAAFTNLIVAERLSKDSLAR